MGKIIVNQVKLQLFGAYQTVVDGEAIERYRSNKVQALLAFMVVEHEQNHPREALMALLWPDIAQKSAQVNLRQTLSRLRSLLPGIVVSDRRTVQIDMRVVSADILTFDRLLHKTTTHSHSNIQSCTDCLARLKEAVALYKGPFLHDFYLPDSDQFEAWAGARRDYYQRRVLDGLSVLTNAQLRAGDCVEALTLAEQQLALDPLRESAHRQLMEALARNGQRDLALAHFDKCQRLFLDELAMTPTKRTIQLAEQIAADELDLAQSQTPAVRGYELLDKLGGGAYGDVHRAYQPLIDREVAVKIIKPEFANRPNFIRRFEVEAQTIARLEHPHIVPLYDYWREPDGAFLVMRYLRGGNLSQALADTGAWPQDRVLQLVDQLGSALAAAHEQGIVHRDLKPANILLDLEGNAYLSDFGIARQIIEPSDSEKIGAQDSNAYASLTSSPYYTSPEQLLGQPVTTRSDIYSFGFLLFELLTGKKPYPDASVGALIHHHLNDNLPSVVAFEPALPLAVDEVLQRATAAEPSERFATVSELQLALNHALQGGIAESTAPIVPQIEGNPYKGLHAFQEADAETFFGRNALTQQLLNHLQDSRFLAVIGPSGSGKSSVVKAGLLPALRKGALDGSAELFITEMVPSTHPLEELETALLRIAVDSPASLLEPLQKDARGLIRTLRRVLPPPDTQSGQSSQLLLVIDQFEELFTLSEHSEDQQQFIALLLAALNDPQSQLHIVLTLRADFFDRPLQLPQLAELIKTNHIVVTPLNRAELEDAILQPARLAGVSFEAGVVSAIVDDIRDQPGMLPLLQYALTELFERRTYTIISRSAYADLGGVTGVLGKRAEEIFGGFSAENQALTRQLFLRLVTLGEGVEDTRRRVLVSELEMLGLDGNPLSVLSDLTTAYGLPITEYGAARLLSFDRDPITRTPTVEVAHEALLREWPRLRGWLNESRDELRLQRRLGVLSAEYTQSNADTSFLLRGGQLQQFEDWAASTTIALTTDEQHYLDASIAARTTSQAEEAARQRRELEQAQTLAETERQRSEEATLRAEEQTASASRLRQRAMLLAGALVIAGILAVAAFIFGNRATENATLAQDNANLAATREADAVSAQQVAQDESHIRATAQAEAETQRTRAEEEARLALAGELAANANIQLAEDPELSMLLALQSLDTAHTPQGETALHSALQTSRLRERHPHIDVAYSSLSPDGNYLAATTKETIGRKFLVYDAQTWELLFEDDGERVYHFIDDNLVVMSVVPWPSIGFRVFDVEKLEYVDYPVVEEFTLSYEEVFPLTYDKALTVFAGAVNPGEIILFDGASGEQVTILQEHEAPIEDIAVSDDSTLLAAYDGDNQMHIWDISQVIENGTADLLDSFLVIQNDSLRGNEMIFNQDKSRLYLGHALGLEIWELSDTSKPIASFAARSIVQAMELNHDESVIAITDSDDIIYILDAATGELHVELLGHQGPPWLAGFSPDGSTLYSSGWGDPLLGWDVRNLRGSEVQAYPTQPWAFRIRVSPDGKLLAVGSLDNPALIIDRASGEIVHTLEGSFGYQFRVEFSPDGKRIVSVGEDDFIRIWDTETGDKLLEFKGHESTDFSGFFRGIMDVKYAPDGNTIATASSDEFVKLWDANSGTLLHELGDYGGPLNRITFSPDGKLLAAVGGWIENDKRKIHIYDVETRELAHTILYANHISLLWGLAFHPTEPLLIGMGDDAYMAVWDVETGEERYNRLLEGGGILSEPAFLNDGDLIATSGSSAPLTIRNTYTGEPVAQLTTYGVENLDITPDNHIVSVRVVPPGEIREFIVDVDEAMALARDRATRELTGEECKQYLRGVDCEAVYEE